MENYEQRQERYRSEAAKEFTPEHLRDIAKLEHCARDLLAKTVAELHSAISLKDSKRVAYLRQRRFYLLLLCDESVTRSILRGNLNQMRRRNSLVADEVIKEVEQKAGAHFDNVLQ
ncbi:MAG: hypothetical protein UY63_C0006G0002 [Parcubacteria group bacterium GW2011_GWA2_51_10]|nr:MAG: hypothetical protein UY63_C0006G0002 [Parcubacteria group bacterium GW2011_GWA2_51_10]